MLLCTFSHAYTPVQFLHATYWSLFLKFFNNLENYINAKYVTFFVLIYLYMTIESNVYEMDALYSFKGPI